MGKYGTKFSHKLMVLRFLFLWGVVFRPLASYFFCIIPCFHVSLSQAVVTNGWYSILILMKFCIKKTETQMFIWIIQDARGW